MTATPIKPVPHHVADHHVVDAINALVGAVNTLNGVSTPVIPED